MAIEDNGVEEIKPSENTFLDLGLSKPEAEVLNAKSQLMGALERAMKAKTYTQNELRHRTGLGRLQVVHLILLRTDSFTFEELVRAAVGLKIDLDLKIGLSIG